MKINNAVCIIIFYSSIIFFSCSYNECNNKIIVTANKCITINKHNFIIDSTTVGYLLKQKIIKDKPRISFGLWDGINRKTGEHIGGIFYYQTVEFENINMQFEDYKDSLDMKLSKVGIEMKEQTCVEILNNIINEKTVSLIDLKIQYNDKSIGWDTHFVSDSLGLQFHLQPFKDSTVLEITPYN